MTLHLGISSLCLLLLISVLAASGFHQNLKSLSFDEAYTHLFGNENMAIHPDRNSVRLSLDERTGSGFVSHDVFLHGLFSASIKLPVADYTAGVVVAFYMSNGDVYQKNHDEIDFEFLGNVRGRKWRIQTNVYGNGSTDVGREERYTLWFDPSDDFHHYTILWINSHITFYVDNVPIRHIPRTPTVEAEFFPSKPMSLFATIWDASDWATNGGRYRINYKYAPYVAHFSDFSLAGCAVDPTGNSSDCETPDETLEAIGIGTIMTPSQRSQMERFRKKHLTYSYCYDRTRYEVPPAECVIGPIESQRLKTRKRRHRRGGNRVGSKSDSM